MTATILPHDAAPEVLTNDQRLSNALAEVRALADAAVDAVVPQEGLRMIVSTPDLRGNGADAVYLAANTPDGQIPLRVLDGAHEQISEKTGIPLPYYRKMLAEEPSLLAANVNRWLYREPKANRLLRMVKPVGAQRFAPEVEAMGSPFAVRAYLSDAYKVVDHYSVLRAVAPLFAERKAEVAEFTLTDRRFHIRALLPVVDVAQMIQRGNHTFLPNGGEMLAFGVSIRNSETGHGAALVETFIRILRCINGLIVDEPFRMAHLGKREQADAEWMSAQTRRLTDAAAVLAIRDRAAFALSEEPQIRAAQKIAEAAGERLELPSAPAVIRFIQTLGAKFDLSKAEREALADTTLEELAQSNVAPSAASRWTASQAFTALGRNMKAEGDFERGVDLERLGWRVMVDPVEALLKAERAASN